MDIDSKSELNSFVDRHAEAGSLPALEMMHMAGAFLTFFRDPTATSASAQPVLRSAYKVLLDDPSLSLHRSLVARQSTEGAKGDTLALTAIRIGPLLDEAVMPGKVPAIPALLLMLILRRHLSGFSWSSHLPVWHGEGMSSMDAEQALLLYNTMFRGAAFVQNVSELKSALPTLDWLGQWKRFGPKKIKMWLNFWPDGADTTALSTLLDFLDKHPGDHQKDLAAHDVRLLLRRIAGNAGARPVQDPAAGRHLQHNGRRLWGVAHNYGLRPLGLSGRGPRVAICVSGQMRGWQATLATWKKHLLPGIQADFFLHVWQEVGRSGTEPHRRFLPFEGDIFQQAYREQCLKMGYLNFVKRYPNLFETLAKSGQLSKQPLSEAYGTDSVVIENDADPRFAGWDNAKKMYYKISMAHQLMQQSDREYDLVVRARPDKAVRLLMAPWQAIKKAVDRSKHVLSDHGMGVHFGSLMVGDQFSVGNPSTMSIYSSTYDDLVALESQGYTSDMPFFVGHTSLARQCSLNELQVGRFPAIFGGLLGAAPMSNQEIQKQLLLDSQGRDDPMDRILLKASAADALKAPAQA